jgi:hypothetical protein
MYVWFLFGNGKIDSSLKMPIIDFDMFRCYGIVLILPPNLILARMNQILHNQLIQNQLLSLSIKQTLTR